MNASNGSAASLVHFGDVLNVTVKVTEVVIAAKFLQIQREAFLLQG
jgi:hypothetical protein